MALKLPVRFSKVSYETIGIQHYNPDKYQLTSEHCYERQILQFSSYSRFTFSNYYGFYVLLFNENTVLIICIALIAKKSNKFFIIKASQAHLK